MGQIDIYMLLVTAALCQFYISLLIFSIQVMPGAFTNLTEMTMYMCIIWGGFNWCRMTFYVAKFYSLAVRNMYQDFPLCLDLSKWYINVVVYKCTCSTVQKVPVIQHLTSDPELARLYHQGISTCMHTLGIYLISFSMNINKQHIPAMSCSI